MCGPDYVFSLCLVEALVLELVDVKSLDWRTDCKELCYIMNIQ